MLHKYSPLTPPSISPQTPPFVLQMLPNEVVVCNPDRGRVAPSGMFEMEVTLRIMDPTSLNTKLEAEVRGGKPIRLPIHAEAVQPSVDVLESNFDFGEVFIGITGRLPLTLINSTAVPASKLSFPFKLDQLEHHRLCD